MDKVRTIAPILFNAPQRDGRDVEVLTIEDLRGRMPAALQHKSQRADFFRLLGVTEGETVPVVDFVEQRSMQRQWVLVRPGQVFRYDLSTDWTGWLLVFRPEALRAVTGPTTVADQALQSRLSDVPAQHSLSPAQHDWMLSSFEQMRRIDEEFSDSGMHKELLRLQLRMTLWRLVLWHSKLEQSQRVKSRAREGYSRFVKLLEDRFTKDHQVAQYAQALGMSEKTLGRICLANTGLSPKTLVKQRLALEARRLLVHTSMSVQSMALELGFVDTSHFAKFFRREVGLSARAFRRSHGS